MLCQVDRATGKRDNGRAAMFIKLPDAQRVMCPECLQPTLSLTEQACDADGTINRLTYRARCASCGYAVERLNVPMTSEDIVRLAICKDLSLIAGSALAIWPSGIQPQTSPPEEPVEIHEAREPVG